METNKDEAIVQIDDLFINFYTYQGVVKALDGISLTINRGETFGLVGETGCGKSVTANAILQLVPTPPGKIEGGHIYFSPTSEVWSQVLSKKERLKELMKVDTNLRDVDELSKLNKEIEDLLKPFDLLTKSRGYMQKIRGKYISMIFQEPMSALNPVITIGDQIAEIILLHEMTIVCNTVLRLMDEDKNSEKSLVANINSLFIPLFRYYTKMVKKDQKAIPVRIVRRIPLLRRLERPINQEALRMAERMLRLVRIPDPEQIIHNYPFELSGGMQQRVIIAMALSCRPQMLIADEPTTALDVTIQAQILKLMKELQQEMGTSILLITHNLGVVAEVCDRVGVMYAGTVVEVADKMRIFEEPLHPYTQGLINSIPKVTQNVDRLDIIEGTVPNLITPPSGCRFNTRCPFVMDTCKEKKPELIEIEPDHTVACHLYGRVAK